MKAETVIYVDAKGAEHEALVRALNGLNPGYITVSYVDVDAPEGDNLKTVYDIPHVTARTEMTTVKAADGSDFLQGNAGLPSIQLNCWKEYHESHTAPAADHPMFDHPFKAKEQDEFGRVVEPERPEYAAQVAAHQASTYPAAAEGEPTETDLDADAKEKAIAEATAGESLAHGVGTIPPSGEMPTPPTA